MKLKTNKDIRATIRSTVASKGVNTLTDDTATAEEWLRICLDDLDEAEKEIEDLKAQIEDLT